jgi:hypothetical protein
MKIIIMSSFLLAIFLLTVSPIAANKETENTSIPVVTIQQEKIRSQYPFPDFLSTAPYVWYDKTEKTPLKGHTYRIATFSDDQRFRIYIEKVEFGDRGCCLEIVEYRQLIINEQFLKKHFPHNKGNHGFKLVHWLNPEVFVFEAYSGRYKLSNISDEAPLIEEFEDKEVKD